MYPTMLKGLFKKARLTFVGKTPIFPINMQAMDSLQEKLDCLFPLGVFSTEQALEKGFSRSFLCLHVKKGDILHVGRGLYTIPSSRIGEDEWLLLAMHHPDIVFSHETALFLNGLAEHIPLAMTVTLAGKASLSPSARKSLRCFYVAPALFPIGLTKRKTPHGHEVPCYGAERTVCDLLRSRRRMDEETVVGGVRNYLALPRSERNLSELFSMAQAFHVENDVRRYVEISL